MPIGVGLLALTALPSLRRPGRVHGLIVAQVAVFFAVLLFGVVASSMRESVPAVPKARSLPVLVLLVFGAGCLALLITRALRTYQLTRRTGDVTVGAAHGPARAPEQTNVGLLGLSPNNPSLDRPTEPAERRRADPIAGRNPPRRRTRRAGRSQARADECRVTRAEPEQPITRSPRRVSSSRGCLPGRAS